MAMDNIPPANDCPLPPWGDEEFAATPRAEVVGAATATVNVAAPSLAPIDMTGGFDLLSAADLLRPQPDAPFVVQGMIRVGSVVLLGAYGGSGKSWLATDLLIAVGAGRKWLGRFACVQGPATFFDYESGQAELGRRIRLLTGASPSPSTPVIDAVVMPPANLTDPSFGARIGALAKYRSLIVIDSLAAASPGVKENDSEMRGGLDVLRRAAEATGCVFVVVVHAKKTSGSAVEIDPREVLRGSSAIYDAADTVLVVSFRQGRPLRVVQCKARHGVHVEPFDVTIADVTGGVRLSASPHRASTQRSQWSELKTQILIAAKRACPSSGNAILVEVKGTRTDKLAALKEVVAEGHLEVAPGGLYRFRTTSPEIEDGK